MRGGVLHAFDETQNVVKLVTSPDVMRERRQGRSYDREKDEHLLGDLKSVNF
jgi:broad-specificity NMP kinase